MAFIPPNDPVAKGPVTVALDRMSVSSSARSKLSKLRTALMGLSAPSYNGLTAVLKQHLLPEVYDPLKIELIGEYLEKSWFSEAQGAWPHHQPIAPTYAMGLIRTLNASLAKGGKASAVTPIDSYWIVDHGRVELLTMKSAQQVTLLIMTPAPSFQMSSHLWSEDAEVTVTGVRSGVTEDEINPLDGDKSVKVGSKKRRLRTYRIKAQESST
jgi:hypothetical protein